MTFEDIGLSPDTLKAVTDAGYQTPTPIQAQAIPLVLMGRDVMGIAQTGTGKTASFTLPMIDILAEGRAKARMPRSLIIAPTRELAAQVSDNFTKYGKYHPLSMALLIGGESMGDQEKVLDRGVDVLIATPGRLLDHFERGRILLNDVKILVIDEADRMLDMGFIPDVERIVSLLPKIRQTLFFSATMNPEIRRLTEKFLMNPKEVQATAPATTATTITQALITVRTEDKRECLRRLIRAENVENAFIFCNRKRDVDIVFKSLSKHGFNVVALHGDMPQPKRMEMLAKFKSGEAKLLVCSDVAARGLDISGVSHVVNFDVPFNSEDYVHRIGRTGRAGKQGHAITIATRHDAKALAAIERLIKQPIPPLVEPAIDELKADGQSGSDDTERDDRKGRSGRGRRGGKPDRSRNKPDRHTPAADAVEAASEQTPAVVETAPVATEPDVTYERPPRRERD
ncbi:MAG: DEAD/DEAH box helicase, partial [Rhodospirillaceae bacterium]|nr:DEAD/DEAH box helicase [Rhodospirillaceae bacterium]